MAIVSAFPDPLAVVYHYTTMDTMLKIVHGASIWATSINYLNDETEGEHFLKIVRKRIPEYRKKNKVEDESIFDAVLRNETKGFEFLPFAASFTHDSDSLTHWRSYCPRGNGVAIGFKVNCLKRAFVEVNGQRIESPFLKPVFQGVTYLKADDLRACDAEIEGAIRMAEYFFDQWGDKGESARLTLAEAFAFVIERRAYFIKDSSFSNEQESRLLVTSTGSH
jgi:hypothetical protein